MTTYHFAQHVVVVLVVAFDNATGEGDLVYDSGTLAEGATVETAALLSLFLDARARDDDPVPSNADRAGWWADSFARDDGVQGSRLWILGYMTASSEAERFAEDAAREALAWMIEDGLAASVDARAQRIGYERIRLDVTITKPDEVAPSLARSWDLEFGGAVR